MTRRVSVDATIVASSRLFADMLIAQDFAVDAGLKLAGPAEHNSISRRAIHTAAPDRTLHVKLNAVERVDRYDVTAECVVSVETPTMSSWQKVLVVTWYMLPLDTQAQRDQLKLKLAAFSFMLPTAADMMEVTS